MGTSPGTMGHAPTSMELAGTGASRPPTTERPSSSSRALVIVGALGILLLGVIVYAASRGDEPAAPAATTSEDAKAPIEDEPETAPAAPVAPPTPKAADDRKDKAGKGGRRGGPIRRIRNGIGF